MSRPGGESEMEFGLSVPADVPRLRALWTTAFGDGDEFLNLFFSTLYRPEEMLVGRERGRVVTMLALLPMTLVDERGGRQRTPYIYALASDPEERGKGWARGLLRFAGETAARRGAAGLCTVPAQASLHRFFASAGFGEGLYTRRETIPRQALLARAPAATGPEDYNALRRKALAGTAYLDVPDELIAFQKAISRLSGAELYMFPSGGCAAVEFDGERAVIKEQFPAAAPARPFGMLRALNGGAGRTAYLGLAFD